MAARDSRDKKGVERFVPPEEQQEKGKNAIFEGSGTKLGDIPIVPINLNKIDADHDLLKAFHTVLYGAVGKKTVRKKNIRSFSGFEDSEDAAARAVRVKKLGASKKWTVAALRDLCTLLGLEKGGDKSDVVDRIITFLCSPDPAASKGPVVKKAKAVKKRKSVGKDGKEKKAKKVKRDVKPRPVSGYIMFCKGARPKLAKEEGPMKPQEVMSKMAKLWSECTDAQKEKFKQAGVAEFEKKQAEQARKEGYEQRSVELDIFMAAKFGLLPQVEQLVSLGVDVNARDAQTGATPLHWASLANATGVIDFLAERGADPNLANTVNGQTPFHWAVINGNVEAAHRLIEVGADKFAADTMGYNALHHASMMGLTMMVHYLVSHGFDVEAGDAQGHTALHWAAYRGHHETATYLVDSGAKLMATDNNGTTALHWAATGGSMPTVEYLLSVGADANLRDGDGDTAADCAGATHPEVARRLLTAAENQARRAEAMRLRGPPSVGAEQEAHQRHPRDHGHDHAHGGHGHDHGHGGHGHDHGHGGDHHGHSHAHGGGAGGGGVVGLATRATDPSVLLPVLWTVAVAVLVANYSFWVSVLLSVAVVFGSYRLATKYLGAMMDTGLWTGATIYSQMLVVAYVFFVHIYATANGPIKMAVVGAMGAFAVAMFKTWSTDPGFVEVGRDAEEMYRLAAAGRNVRLLFCEKCFVRRPLRSLHCNQCGKCVSKYSYHSMFVGTCVGGGNERWGFLLISSVTAFFGAALTAAWIHFGNVKGCPSAFAPFARLGFIYGRDPLVALALIVALVRFFFSLKFVFSHSRHIMLGLTEFEGANEERIAYLRGAQRRLLDRGLTMNIKIFFGLAPSPDWSSVYPTVGGEEV